MDFKEIYPIDPILAQAIVAWVGLDKLKLILQEAKDIKDWVDNGKETGIQDYKGKLQSIS